MWPPNVSPRLLHAARVGHAGGSAVVFVGTLAACNNDFDYPFVGLVFGFPFAFAAATFWPVVLPLAIVGGVLNRAQRRS